MVSTSLVGGHHGTSQRRGTAAAQRGSEGAGAGGVRGGRRIRRGRCTAHGLNANLVHRLRRIAEGREAGPGFAVSQAFVALPLPPSDSTPCARAEIRIELRRAGVSIGVAWPVSAARSMCGVEPPRLSWRPVGVSQTEMADSVS